MGRLSAASHSQTFEQIERTGRSYAEDLADHRNRHMERKDIEWAVNGDQLYLRDKQSWTARRTRELEQAAEDDRRRWIRSQERLDD